MKLSFSMPSKSTSKSNHIRPSKKFDGAADNQDGNTKGKEYVTEFDASKSPTDPNKSSNIVIPPIMNEWNERRSRKRMKNLDLPITESNGTELGFELDTSAAVEPGSEMSYGLNLRQTRKSGGDGKQSAAGSGGGDAGDDDDGRSRSVSLDAVVLQKFKDDMNRLPDDNGFEEFKDVPVEGFGAALLAGYGWREGMGIGKNATEDIKVVQYEKRTAKEGLGYVGDGLKRSLKEVEIPKEHGKDGSFVGKIVRIVEGRDAGLKGKIVRKVEDKWVILKLLKSEEEVKVDIDDIAELGSIEDERYLKKLRELKIEHADKDKDKDSKNKRNRNEERRGRGEVEVNIKRDSRKEEQGRKQVSWLTSHIRVRIISKDFKGGRLYLKKGKVLDVVGPTTCDISMDDSKEIIQGVSQDLLETALPRRGGPVLVLYGKHKGIYGSLVERDLEREIGVVRDADTHALVNVRLEQIAEYIGDPSILGY